ncbi:hypothetical protein [Bradyrhizobium barranii]
MSESYLVQILLPKETGKGEKIPKDWFDGLTDKFGASTDQGCCDRARQQDRPHGMGHDGKG